MGCSSSVAATRSTRYSSRPSTHRERRAAVDVPKAHQQVAAVALQESANTAPRRKQHSLLPSLEPTASVAITDFDTSPQRSRTAEDNLVPTPDSAQVRFFHCKPLAMPDACKEDSGEICSSNEALSLDSLLFLPASWQEPPKFDVAIDGARDNFAEWVKEDSIVQCWEASDDFCVASPGGGEASQANTEGDVIALSWPGRNPTADDSNCRRKMETVQSDCNTNAATSVKILSWEGKLFCEDSEDVLLTLQNAIKDLAAPLQDVNGYYSANKQCTTPPEVIQPFMLGTAMAMDSTAHVEKEFPSVALQERVSELLCERKRESPRGPNCEIEEAITLPGQAEAEIPPIIQSMTTMNGARCEGEHWRRFRESGKAIPLDALPLLAPKDKASSSLSSQKHGPLHAAAAAALAFPWNQGTKSLMYGCQQVQALAPGETCSELTPTRPLKSLKEVPSATCPAQALTLGRTLRPRKQRTLKLAPIPEIPSSPLQRFIPSSPLQRCSRQSVAFPKLPARHSALSTFHSQPSAEEYTEDFEDIRL